MKKKTTKPRLPYIPPKIEVKLVGMEVGIAAASATVTFTGPTNQEATPQVESWQVGQTDGSVFDW